MASRNRCRALSYLTMSITAWLELVASGLITGGIYALVALGLNLQYGLMRILNIAHGEFLMVGAYLTWMVQTSFGLSPLWMVPVSFGVLMALGLAVHGLCFRRLTATSPNLDIFEARGLMVSPRPDVSGTELCLDGLGRRSAWLRFPDGSGEAG